MSWYYWHKELDKYEICSRHPRNKILFIKSESGGFTRQCRVSDRKKKSTIQITEFNTFINIQFYDVCISPQSGSWTDNPIIDSWPEKKTWLGKFWKRWRLYIARMRALKVVQRAVKEFIYRPGGPMFLKFQDDWNRRCDTGARNQSSEVFSETA